MSNEKNDASDSVYCYASEVMSLGLLLQEFNDAIREGDGEWILRCWKFLLLIFRASGRTNYAIEAFHLLAQYKFILTSCMATQLKWSRAVNTLGRPGKNMSCDLPMEHLNRIVKSSMSELRSNITDSSILRMGRSLNNTSMILRN